MTQEMPESSTESYESALVDAMNYLLKQGIDLKPERPERSEDYMEEFDEQPKEELEDGAYLESILANLHKLASEDDTHAEGLLSKLTEKLKDKL